MHIGECMLYISGENENLEDLKDKEGFEGLMADYVQKFHSLNPHLSLNKDSQQLPSYMPMYLVSQPRASYGYEVVARELGRFSIEERKILRKLQDSHYDIPVLVTMTDFLEDFQSYASDFRKRLDDPLISTPWNAFNRSFTTTSLVDIFSETSLFGSKSIQQSKRFGVMDKLYEDMLARDVLNNRLDMLKGDRSVKARTLMQSLEKQKKEFHKQIKQQLPRRIDDAMSKNLNGFKPDDVRKMRIDSYSKKMARKGRLATTQLDVLNKSGLNSLRRMISQLKTLSEHAGKFSTYLGIGVVAYDTIEAYRNHAKVARTLFSGAAGIGTALVMGEAGMATVGAFTIGALTGEVALSGTILFSGPVGWVCAIVGIGAVSYSSFKASEFVQDFWDCEYGQDICNKVSSTADILYDDFKSAWSNGSRWLLDFYGGDR